MGGRGTACPRASDLIVLIVIIEIENAASAVVEGVPAVALHSCPRQVQELELRVCISCGGTRGSHLPMVFRDVAELVPHAKSRRIDAAASSADPPRLSVVDLADNLVLVYAHLVQLLSLSNQNVLTCFVQVHRLRQVLALPRAHRLALGEASSATDAAEAHDPVRSDQKLLLLALIRSPSATRVGLSPAIHRDESLSRQYLGRNMAAGRGMLRLRSVQIDELLLVRVDLLLRLRLEARMWPLLLSEAAILLLQKCMVLLVLRQTGGLHMRRGIGGAASLPGVARGLILFDVEIAYEVHLVLAELLGAEAVRGANGGVLADLVGAPDGQQLGLGGLALAHVRSLRFLDLALVRMRA